MFYGDYEDDYEDLTDEEFEELYGYKREPFFENPFGIFSGEPLGRLGDLADFLDIIGIRASEMSKGSYEDSDGDGIADDIYSGRGALSGEPVNIIQRNEAGEQIGTILGIRIGYGDNKRVVTLDELASINKARKRAGQDEITTRMTGYVPVFVDESGATVSNETSNVRTPSTTTTTTPTPPALPATSTSAPAGTSARPTTPTPSIYGIEGGGGGTRIITLPGGRTIPVPEGLNPLQLLTQGLITREIYKQETGEDAPDTISPDDTDTDIDTDIDTDVDTDTDIDTDTDVDTDIDTDVDTDTNTEIDTDTDKDMNEEEETIDETIDDGVDDGTGTGTGTGTGAGTGTGEGFDYEKFFQMLSAIPAFQSGASFEAGEVPGIYPTAIESLPQASAFIQSILELDRPVSEQQAGLKTDIYGNIIEDVREAQGPLMQSLAQRSDMLGARAEGLMGQLSFLENRAATQAGFGQASALGREIDPLLREQQAGRLREEQKNINLQLASNLLGQQRATAGLMADIEGGIYSQIAPEIGVDPGQVLGITGMDIGNILGERQGTRAAEAISRGAERQLYAQAIPYAGQAVQFGYDMIRNLLNRNKDSAGFSINQDTRPMANVNPIV
jgi:hypothetical protein